MFNKTFFSSAQNMEKNNAEETWAFLNPTKIALNTLNDTEQDDDDDDEGEEALSLSDLPLVQHSRKERDKEDNGDRVSCTVPPQEEFDFCSLSKESEMCAADEVFFQGQILPWRNSVSSEVGLPQYSDHARSVVFRSESMDHYHSGGLISSRSSSISSGQSSSTSGSGPKYKHGLPPRNQFQYSHSSPSPRLRHPSNRHGINNGNNRSCAKKSSLWNIFQLGLVTSPPEIAFQDLKTRNSNARTNCRNFGSRNSTSSNSSSFSSNNSNNNNNNKKKKNVAVDKKKKPTMGFLGGCKCSADAVDTVTSRVAVFRRSASLSETAQSRVTQGGDHESVDHQSLKSAKSTKQQATKKQLSHHRTFEWLKQLSIEGTVDGP